MLRHRAKTIALAFGLILTTLSLAYAATVPGLSEAEQDRQFVAARPLSASDLASVSGAYVGKTVRVRSQVSRTFGPHAFLLSDEPLLAAPNVLVLVPNPRAPAPGDYMLNVVGTVRPFNRRQLEREYSWFKADLFRGTILMSEWQEDGVTVVVAQSIRTGLNVELVQGQTPDRGDMGMSAAGQSGSGQSSKPLQSITSLGTLFRSDNPASLVGNPVTLTAIRVDRVLDPEFIVVGTDAQHQVLVRLAQPTQDIIAGDVVSLSGAIQLVPALPSDWELAQQPPVAIQARQIELVNH